MNDRGISLIETLVGIIIVGLTTGIVIGIVILHRNIISDTKLYNEYLDEKIRIVAMTKPISAYSETGHEIELFLDNENWSINCDGNLIIEYQNGVLINHQIQYSYKPTRIKRIIPEVKGRFLSLLLFDDNHNHEIYMGWKNGKQLNYYEQIQ